MEKIISYIITSINSFILDFKSFIMDIKIKRNLRKIGDILLKTPDINKRNKELYRILNELNLESSKRYLIEYINNDTWFFEE